MTDSCHCERFVRSNLVRLLRSLRNDYIPRMNERLPEGKINMAAGGTTGELAQLFVRLGFTAFGGPAAHIAMMEDEVVARRRWFTHEEFLDMLGVTNLIPGPNSTEMALHIGYRRGGLQGLVVAGASFILPAMLVTLAFAAVYTAYGTVPALGTIMGGIRAAIIAVILGAVSRLGKPLVKNPFQAALGTVVGVLSVLRVDALALLLVAGAAGIAWKERGKIRRLAAAIAPLPAALCTLRGALPPGASSLSSPPEGATLTGLGLFFLKIGSILYGGGYVLVAFLQQGLVEGRGWLTQSKLLDAIAVGQFTPGPILSTATFIGYTLFGIPGAIVSTGAIFLPSFVFVTAVGPFVPKLRKSEAMKGFLDGVNAGALGLMAGVCITLGIATLTGVTAICIFVVAAVVVFRWRVNAAWIVAGAAAAGWVAGLF